MQTPPQAKNNLPLLAPQNLYLLTQIEYNPTFTRATKRRAMDITINGKVSTISTGTTAAELIVQLGLAETRLALEVNQDIIRRSEYSEFTLHANDKVEVVHAIGGG